MSSNYLKESTPLRKEYDRVSNSLCSCEQSKFEVLARIGEGAYGDVLQARAKDKNNKIVALKKLKPQYSEEYYLKYALREINISQQLQHKNIVQLTEIYKGEPLDNSGLRSLILEFEFCDYDLEELLSIPALKFSLSEIRCVSLQLLTGIEYLHSKNIMHRDLKPNNILITKNGILKIADFGLAREANESSNTYTNEVVTLWYRPPEILLGATEYGFSVDIWSIGCIIAELCTLEPILKGTSDQYQLLLISKMCGPIRPSDWPGIESTCYGNIDEELGKYRKRNVISYLKNYVKCDDFCELIDQMLILNPERRISANVALKHNFFVESPDSSSLLNVISRHSKELESNLKYGIPDNARSPHGEPPQN